MTASEVGAVPDDVIEEVMRALHAATTSRMTWPMVLAQNGPYLRRLQRDARAVLSVPALAEAIARDAKVREMWPVVDRLEDHWCECPLPPDAGCSRCHDFFHARSTIAALYPEAGK